MSKKLKIILGALVVLAGFLLTRIGLTIKNSAETASRVRGESTIAQDFEENNVLTQDSDNDGLSDWNEVIYATDPFNKDTDGDGYLDGEEIVSGYDSLDPDSNSETGTTATPGLSQNSINLTDRLINLTMASTINNYGQFDPGQVNDQIYADIFQSINNEGSLSIFVPPTLDSDIRITEDNGPQSVNKYINSAAKVIEEVLFSSTGGITQNLNNIASSESDYPNYYENAYRSLKILEVPSSWKEIHKTSLTSLLQLAKSFGVVKKLESDPVLAIFAVNQIQDSFLRLTGLLNQAAILAKDQDVVAEDSIASMLQLINGYLPTPK